MESSEEEIILGKKKEIILGNIFLRDAQSKWRQSIDAYRHTFEMLTMDPGEES